MLEEVTTGMADLVVVNSRFTASTFAKTFKRLDSQGIKPAVLYPAVNLAQFDEPSAYNLNFLSINRFERKKNIALAISSFAMLRVHEKDVLQGQGLAKVSLTIAGGFDSRLRENVEYLEELKSLADKEGVSDRVKFITSCSTTERNDLLSQCLCVLYTSEVLSMSRLGGAGAVAQLVADVPLSSVEGGGGEGGDNQTAISLKKAKGGEAKRIKQIHQMILKVEQGLSHSRATLLAEFLHISSDHRM